MPTVDSAISSMESIKAAIKMLDDCPVPRNDYQPYGDVPVFTQKHYVAVANVIHQKRREITTAHQATFGEADVKAVKLEATNDVTLALCKLFKGDNPKFNDFQFIAACNRDLEGK